jgi:hypothetical protein
MDKERIEIILKDIDSKVQKVLEGTYVIISEVETMRREFNEQFDLLLRN